MAHTHERQIYKDVGGSNDKNVPWFTKDVDDSNIGKAARELLETYSGIPAEEVLAHVLAIVRDRQPPTLSPDDYTSYILLILPIHHPKQSTP